MIRAIELDRAIIARNIHLFSKTLEHWFSWSLESRLPESESTNRTRALDSFFPPFNELLYRVYI